MTSFLEIQREMTKAYISQDPTDIVLIPTVKTHTDSGSTVIEDGTPRKLQTFKMILLQGSGGSERVLTVDGVERTIAGFLLGAYDCVMQAGDHWTGADGRRYEVIAMQATHGYETKGAIEAHGA
jgi:hypothetical protein